VNPGSTGSSCLLVLSRPANAGKTLEEAGALVCVTDKWDEKEPEKGHKLADAVMRCVVPQSRPDKYRKLHGKAQYMPDGN
jgi:hypothetical protein